MATPLLLRNPAVRSSVITPARAVRWASLAPKGWVHWDPAAATRATAKHNGSSSSSSSSSSRRAIESKLAAWRPKTPTRSPEDPTNPMTIDPTRPLSLRAIHNFFKAEFPRFDYDRRKPFPDEFLRLHRYQGWPALRLVHRHARRDAAWRRYHAAVYEAFSDTFGRNTRSTFSWALLCRCIDIEQPEVHDLESMRRAVIQKNLNIVDVMASLQRKELNMVDETTPEPCATEKELETYPIKKTIWYFPLLEDLNPTQGLLLYLIRQLEGKGRFRWNEKKKPQPAWEERDEEEVAVKGPLDMMGQLIIE
ncbi:hypothetical protein FN846DRAFT_618348 [Sphaerosporella brunnea]|uniref:Uncharacterized protein n=1 Tax=Sphaerosporella brunnea TaxID=1250544 RepID=A0A5J5EDM7_9PEZI|nr:hypothetical protein FN846DRAFT_618348 [Sphaerosporella brunnea]